MGSFEDGMAVRRQVLGSDHVDRAVANTTDLDRGFQSWITENIWGGIWAREGLDLKTRSMITIAILAALNHEELELHLRAAANTGVAREEIAEIFLHVTAYAGAPAGNRSFKVAKSLYDGSET